MAQEKKERIFISYKRVDRERVFAIKDGIKKATGEDCWIDLDGIESDAQFANVIIKVLRFKRNNSFGTKKSIFSDPKFIDWKNKIANNNYR